MRMKNVFSILFLFALFADVASAQTGGLSERVREAGRGSQAVWVSWTVPVIDGHEYTCCMDRKFKPATCKLEEKNQSWGSSDQNQRQDPNLNVLVRLQNGKAERIRSVSESCPVEAGSVRIVQLEGVKPEESVRFLTGLVKEAKAETDEEAISSLALHRNSGALDSLAEFATSSRYRMDVREQSLFWLGQSLGRAGYEVIARVLRDDSNDELREHATFALSESPVPEAGELLVKTARTDRHPEVRSQAMFWLAQIDHPQAPAIILEAIAKDADEDVREQGVFALSQLPDGKGVPMLIRLGRESKDREVRKQALFWLTESDDPAAVKFLEKMLEE